MYRHEAYRYRGVVTVFSISSDGKAYGGAFTDPAAAGRAWRKLMTGAKPGEAGLGEIDPEDYALLVSTDCDALARSDWGTYPMGVAEPENGDHGEFAEACKAWFECPGCGEFVRGVGSPYYTVGPEHCPACGQEF